MIKVRPLEDADLRAAALLHRDVLDMEFLARFGLSFMRTYYRAWIHSPGSISLAATDENEKLVGVLLGATDPATHFRAMVRFHGLRIGAKLVAYALVHPALAKDLVVTRGRRYARGVARLVRARFSQARSVTASQSGPAVGEITHVLVDRGAQGSGIGRALVEASIDEARAAGVHELVLVTPPDMEAKRFYERLGWQLDGSLQSRSGENFLRFRYVVPQ
ncbi:MAG TPA: GNAT family N-acetyltransferase [Acidimicrobiales bacterium]|nr:GNAT family N-acetyltransferase [Acidimicrobiales bacterium]